uniref:NADH dehydrogenase subunit 6 n=1 Tax=Catenella fusiformis TaxID=3024791 RepID=UPI003001B582|nr:NADH dehydrogenase subunit 6 [Catenella fusiformis]
MSPSILLFYVLSTFILLSSLMVISLSNAVHSVLFLILVFCNTSGLLLLFGAEFLSLMLIIVYVGAIAVLFLFVVMMLNVKLSSSKIQNFSILPVSILVFIILFNQFKLSVESFDLIKSQQKELEWISWILESSSIINVKAIGGVLYTKYSLLFLLCGLILLIAMIGVIVLTMHQRIDVKKQKIAIQLSRKSNEVIKFVNLRK